MREFFFSDPLKKLIYLLAIPAVPLKNASSDPTAEKEVAGAWAGDRIICLGSYARSWPNGVVTDADFSEMASEAKHYSAAFTESCKTVETVDFGDEWKASYPNGSIWVLRNLNKKLYVRSNGIPTASKDYRLTYAGHCGLQGFPGLGNVLLANIGWSEHDSTLMCYSGRGNLANGRWAGDRIDVCLMDDVVEDMTKEGWKDISRQEAIRLYEIWCEEEGGGRDLQEEPTPASLE
jgi:hypothetical protein